MKKLLIAGLALFLAGLATTALADRGYRGDGYSGRHDRGDRIDHRLDVKGDHIERRFDRLADRAAERGHYREAYRLKEKGEWINRRLDRKGHRLKARFDHRSRHDWHHRRHHHSRHYRGGLAPRHYRYHDHLRLGFYVPGFWFSGTWRE